MNRPNARDTKPRPMKTAALDLVVAIVPVCALLAGCGASPTSASTEPTSADAGARRIAFVGDSITAGSGSTTPATCYVAVVQGLLPDPDVAVSFGVGGTTAQAMPPSTWTPYTSHGEYSEATAWPATDVVIALGTNDAWAALPPSGTWNGQGYHDGIAGLVAHFRADHDAPRVWLAVPPASPLLDAEVANDVRPALQALASELSVPLVDDYAATQGQPALFVADGVHPNDQGHAIIGHTMAAALLAQ